MVVLNYIYRLYTFFFLGKFAKLVRMQIQYWLINKAISVLKICVLDTVNLVTMGFGLMNICANIYSNPFKSYFDI